MPKVIDNRGRIRNDDADLWLRANDPDYARRSRPKIPVAIPPDDLWLDALVDVDEQSLEPCVYFIQAENGGPVKIGKCLQARSVRERMVALQCAHPYPLVIRRLVKGRKRLERQLHLRFASLRTRPDGEWFELDDTLRRVARIG
jgi:hypothetical protein